MKNYKVSKSDNVICFVKTCEHIAQSPFTDYGLKKKAYDVLNFNENKNKNKGVEKE